MSELRNFPRSLGHLQFLLLGITSLLGYNAVMNTLDYFASKYNYNVYFLFSPTLHAASQPQQSFSLYPKNSQ